MSDASVVKRFCEVEADMRKVSSDLIAARIDFRRFLPKDWESDPDRYPEEYRERVHAFINRVAALDQPMEDTLVELQQLVRLSAEFIPSD